MTQLNGRDVYLITLTSRELTVRLTNIGCSIVSIEMADRQGIRKNIVAGFGSLEEYLVNRDYLGCTVGRYANRIADGRFEWEGRPVQLTVNDAPNHLHGGVEGFHKKIWDIGGYVRRSDRVEAAFHYTSEDGEEGYPGNLHVTVTYSLNDKGQLEIKYEAETDKTTPVNLTNHTYFNLTGFDTPNIYEHLLQVNARHFTEKNERNIPTGVLSETVGTPLDFSQPKKLGEGMDQFPLDFGFDHNFVLEKRQANELTLAATLQEPASGRIVNVYTTQPGIQIYSANYWDGTVVGRQGLAYQQHGAVAMETQSFPDSPNKPKFPDTLLRPGQLYHSRTIYEFDSNGK